MTAHRIGFALGKKLWTTSAGHFLVFLIVHVDRGTGRLLSFDFAQLGADFVRYASQPYLERMGVV